LFGSEVRGEIGVAWFRVLKPWSPYSPHSPDMPCTVCDTQLVLRQTYGYLPGRKALRLFLGRYSFLVPPRVGG